MAKQQHHLDSKTSPLSILLHRGPPERIPASFRPVIPTTCSFGSAAQWLGQRQPLPATARPYYCPVLDAPQTHTIALHHLVRRSMTYVAKMDRCALRIPTITLHAALKGKAYSSLFTSIPLIPLTQLATCLVLCVQERRPPLHQLLRADLPHGSLIHTFRFHTPPLPLGMVLPALLQYIHAL